MLCGHGIDKRLLRQPLAIIKRSGHFERGDVLPQCGELFFLRHTDASGRVQNHDTDSGDSQKGVRHSAPGVAGRRGDDRELLPRFPDKVSHQPRHEARAEILERKCRSVEQLEDVQMFRE